jgi:hypothetical protein
MAQIVESLDARPSDVAAAFALERGLLMYRYS